MAEDKEISLFQLKLNTSGKIYVRKFAFFSRIIILISIVITLVHIASTVIRYFTLDPSVYDNYEYLQLENTLLPYYTALYCLVFFLQMYLYWQATRHLKKGLNYDDEDTFNKAFHTLFRYSVVGVISLLMSLVFYGFDLFVFVKYYVN